MLGNPVVNITIPVLNEEAQLESSVQKILGTVETLSLAVELVIADNGSTDRTQQIGERLAAELKGVYYCRLAEVGRGRAIKAVWMNSRAGVLSYMDVDLSTDLSCFNALITPVRTNTADLCIGSRLLKGSRVKRGIKREILSRGYNYSLQRLLHLQVRDAQCGFKAVTLNAAKELVSDVRDTAWFFDTELLVLAQSRGYRVIEIPVVWIDDPDSSVRLGSTIFRMVQGIMRLRKARSDRQILPVIR